MLIITPSRRDFLRYGGVVAACYKVAQAQTLRLGPQNTFGGTPITLLVHAQAGQNASGGGTTAVTPARDTSNASLIVLAVSSYAVDSQPTISDSASNTWTALTAKAAPVSRVRFYYCVSPTTSATHTFTSTASGSTSQFTGIIMFAFRYTKTSTPADQESAGATTAAGTTLQPGSITPAENNEVVLTAVALTSTSGTSIDNSYSADEILPYSAGNYIGLALAYKVQTTAAATNPTWTLGASVDAATISESFKAP